MSESFHAESSTASNLLELEVLRLAGPNCWACATMDAQCAKLISQTDRQMFASDKAWHGDPIATLRRAIATLGSARVGVLDTNTIDQLQQLRDLYFSDYASPKMSLLYRHKTPPKRLLGDRDNEDERQHKRRCFLQDSTSDTSQNGPASNLTDKPPPSNVSDTSAWVLGPQSSTNETIERFAAVFANTNIVDLLLK